jgi:glycine/sarcosine N-methyltransferase
MSNPTNLSAQQFYERLSDNYHLISIGWPDAVRLQGQIIDEVLTRHLKLPGPLTILDCSCGIGTQALGLALQSHKVTGSDISQKEIERAQKAAREFEVDATFEVADMKNLKWKNRFDAAISFDNSIAHLTEDADLVAAFRSMKSTLRKNGSILVSLRDYDQLAKERPTGMLPKRIKDQFGDRVYLQTWEWDKDAKFYDMSLFVLKNSGQKWESEPIVTKMRAYRHSEVDAALSTAGFTEIRWLLPDETGYYQPIVSAR